jgi:hypothetical protein
MTRHTKPDELVGEGLDRKRVAPAWGWRHPHSGRLPHITPAVEYVGTTTQIAGLYPFLAGSGSPDIGVPVGRHLHWGEAVAFDPFAWVQHGITTNPGTFILGQPGTGKSSFVKRTITGLAAFGIRTLVLGDVKPEYGPLVEALGGQVIRVGRGLDVINPLDSGPLGTAIGRLHQAGKHAAAIGLQAELRGRRLTLLAALCVLVRGNVAVTAGEEIVLGAAIDHHTTSRPDVDPTIPEILHLIRTAPASMVEMCEVTPKQFPEETKALRQTLRLLCEGSLRGMFDGPTTRPIDMNAPAVSIDISAVASAGDDVGIAAAMLCVWSYGFGIIDATLALAEEGLEPARNYLAVMDELWRALRGAPGLVERADALTRVNRTKGVAQIMITHSLRDLDALPTEADRAKARGFVERCAVTVLAGLPPRELAAVAEVTGGLTDRERQMVTSWSTPETWTGTNIHPGRGKYLIKCGPRTGIPIEMSLQPGEVALYDTDRHLTGHLNTGQRR